MKTLCKGGYWGTFCNWNEDISATRRAMNTFESALESWDFILFDARTFRPVRTLRENSSVDFTHKRNFQFWGKNTKMRLQKKIMRVNGGICFERVLWWYFLKKLSMVPQVIPTTQILGWKVQYPILKSKMTKIQSSVGFDQDVVWGQSTRFWKS